MMDDELDTLTFLNVDKILQELDGLPIQISDDIDGGYSKKARKLCLKFCYFDRDEEVWSDDE